MIHFWYKTIVRHRRALSEACNKISFVDNSESDLHCGLLHSHEEFLINVEVPTASRQNETMNSCVAIYNVAPGSAVSVAEPQSDGSGEVT